MFQNKPMENNHSQIQSPMAWWEKRRLRFFFYTTIALVVGRVINYIASPVKMWQLEDSIGYILIAQIAYVIPYLVETLFNKSNTPWRRQELWRYYLLLWIGIALFPTACVLFLVKPRF